MARSLPSIGVFALLTTLAIAPLPAAADEAPTAPQLEDFEWLVGHWQGEPPGGGLAEEFWTAPSAGTMMGAFRWTRGDKVIVYEFLLLEETEEGLVLRLRHFGRGSVAWEDKESPLDFWVQKESTREGLATFQAETEDGWLRLIFKQEGTSGLVITLERESGGPLEFQYRRV